MEEKALEFVPYVDHNPLCPVTAITPADEAYMHTYYDVCPWSPSGRRLVCLRLPFEAREPAAADTAELCVMNVGLGATEDLFSACQQNRSFPYTLC